MDEVQVLSRTQRIIVEKKEGIKLGDARIKVTVVDAGPPGPAGLSLPGPAGPAGPAGPTGDVGASATYVHVQNSTSDVWTIQHNLDRYPAVEVVDSAGSVVLGSTRYINSNQIEVSFIYPFSGKAFLN